MAEKATNKVMLQDLNDSMMNIISDQEISPENVGELKSKRYLEVSNQGTPLEHSIQLSERISIRKSSEIDKTEVIDIVGSSDEEIDILGSSDEEIDILGSSDEEIDVLGYSDEDCAKVEVNFLTQDSDKRVHTTEERKGKEFGDWDIIESGHEYVQRMFKPETCTFDTLRQASEPYRLKVDSTADMLSTDSAPKRVDISSSQLDGSQVIEQCMKDVAKNITVGPYGEVQYLVSSNTEILKKCLGATFQISEQNMLPSDELKIVTHQTLPLENLMKPSDLQVETDDGNVILRSNHNLKMSDFSSSDELKMKQLNKALKDIDLLSSCTEEIGRMNEIFKSKVFQILSELMEIRRSIKYVKVNLSLVKGLPACTIIFRQTAAISKVINVVDFGVRFLDDQTKHFYNLKELLMALNKYRLTFIALSETFSFNPFELHVGKSQNSVLDAAFAAALTIYKEFFENESWDIRHENLSFSHELLQILGKEFDKCIEMLS